MNVPAGAANAAVCGVLAPTVERGNTIMVTADPATVDFGVGGGGARRELDRAVVAQELFDGTAHECGTFTQMLPLVRVSQQSQQTVADQVHRRLVPRGQQEDTRRQKFLR